MGIGIGFIVLLVFVAMLLLWIAGTYNSFIGGRNEVKNAWSQIDVQLKRRHDLIPNLVETAKGYMDHERETLENITKARNLAAQSSGVTDQSKAEGELNRAMSNFFVVVENYPDLKANQNFLQLQEELASTENKISFARQYYNDEAMKFNTRIQQFPGNFIANSFNFKAADFFQVEDAKEREVPKVSF